MLSLVAAADQRCPFDPNFYRWLCLVPLSPNPTFILSEKTLKFTKKRSKDKKSKGFDQDSRVSGLFSIKQPSDSDSTCKSKSSGIIWGQTVVGGGDRRWSVIVEIILNLIIIKYYFYYLFNLFFNLIILKISSEKKIESD